MAEELREERAMKASIRAMLIADTTISTECKRVMQEMLPIIVNRKGDLPQVTYDMEYTGKLPRQPATEWDLRVGVWVAREQNLAKQMRDRICRAIRALLNVEDLTDVINAQGYDTKCRLCEQVSAINLREDDTRLHHTSMVYRVVLGM